MNKYSLKGAIIGFIFGFLIIFIGQIAQRNYCPFEPLLKKIPDPKGLRVELNKSIDERNNRYCPNNLTTPDKSIGNAYSCKNGIIVIRSNCLSTLVFWGYPNDIPLIPNIFYAFVYGSVGLIIGYLYGILKEKYFLKTKN